MRGAFSRHSTTRTASRRRRWAATAALGVAVLVGTGAGPSSAATTPPTTTPPATTAPATTTAPPTPTVTTTPAPEPVGSLVRPVAPVRILDTRNGVGGRRGALSGGAEPVLAIPEVPAGTTSVTVTVTVVAPTAAGWLSVDATPTVSGANVRFPAGVTTSTTVLSAVTPERRLGLHLATRGTAHVVVDVIAYASPSQGNLLYRPQTPRRVLDTRIGAGTPRGALGKACVSLDTGVPEATRAMVSVTVVGATGNGSLSSAATAAPTIFSYRTGLTSAGLVVLDSPGGSGTLCNLSATKLHLIVDLHGVYAATGAGSRHVAVPLRRALDTVAGVGAPAAPLAPGADVTVDVPGVPDDATAVTLTLAVTGPTAGGWLSVGPERTTSTSNLSFPAATTVSTAVVTKLGAGGTVVVHNGSAGTVQVMADVQGYDVPSPLEIVPRTPAAVVSTSYTADPPLVRGGTGAYRRPTITGLPAWLTFDPYQRLRGTAPATPGESELEFRVADTAATFAQAQVPLAVLAKALPVGSHRQTLLRPALVREQRGTLHCAADGTCADAVDGRAYVWFGGAWHEEHPFASVSETTGAVDVACASRQLCVAVSYDSAGRVAVRRLVDGTPTWTLAPAADRLLSAYTVSCTSTACLVRWGEADTQATYWSKVDLASVGAPAPLMPGTDAKGVSFVCTSGGCTVTAVDFGPGPSFSDKWYKLRWSGTAWTAPVRLEGRFQPVWCASAADVCLGAGGSGELYRLTGTTFAAVHTPASLDVGTVTCTTATSCRAGLTDGRLAAYDGRSWRAVGPQPPAALRSLVCASATSCVAVTDSSWTTELTGGAWTAPAPTMVAGVVAELDCPWPSFCVARDSQGELFTFDVSAWSGPVPVGATKVDCSSRDWCVALRSDGRVSAWDGDAWTTLGGAPGRPGDLSCPKDGTCWFLGGDSADVVWQLSDGEWGAPEITGTDRTNGLGSTLSCLGDGWCLVSGSPRSAVRRDGVWVLGGPGEGPGSVRRLDCSSRRECVAGEGGNDARLWALRDGVWKVLSTAGNGAGAYTQFACAGLLTCVSVDGSVARILDGGAWFTVPGTGMMTAVACPATRACFMGEGSDVRW